MSIEQTANQRVPFQEIKEKVDDRYIDFLVNRAESIFQNSRLDYAVGAKDSYLAAKHDGYVRILVPAHFVHLDALGVAVVGEHLDTMEAEEGVENPTKGTLLTIAKSVESGHQGPLLKKGYDKVKEKFESHGLKTHGYVRPEDQRIYGLKSNSIETGRVIRNALNEGRGLALFPGGSVQAGRRRELEPYEPTGNFLVDKRVEIMRRMQEAGLISAPVNGIQQFDGNVLRQLSDTVSRNGRKAAFVPIMIDGVYRLVRPTDEIDRKRKAQKEKAKDSTEVVVFEDKNKITPRGIISVLSPFDLGTVRFRVGPTCTIDEIQNLLGEDFTDEKLGDFIGRNVAKLYPPEHRGHYANVT